MINGQLGQFSSLSYMIGCFFICRKGMVIVMGDIPIIDIVKTGEKISQLRREKNLAVKDLQTVFGFTTPQAIYKWQRGTALPTVDNLVVLASIFKVTIDDILVVCDGKHTVKEVCL